MQNPDDKLACQFYATDGACVGASAGICVGVCVCVDVGVCVGAHGGGCSLPFFPTQGSLCLPLFTQVRTTNLHANSMVRMAFCTLSHAFYAVNYAVSLHPKIPISCLEKCVLIVNLHPGNRPMLSAV